MRLDKLFLVIQSPINMCLGKPKFYITFCIWSYVQAIIKSIRSCIDTVYHINLTQRWLQGSNPVGNRRKQNVKKE